MDTIRCCCAMVLVLMTTSFAQSLDDTAANRSALLQIAQVLSSSYEVHHGDSRENFNLSPADAAMLLVDVISTNDTDERIRDFAQDVFVMLTVAQAAEVAESQAPSSTLSDLLALASGKEISVLDAFFQGLSLVEFAETAAKLRDDNSGYDVRDFAKELAGREFAARVVEAGVRTKAEEMRQTMILKFLSLHDAISEAQPIASLVDLDWSFRESHFGPRLMSNNHSSKNPIAIVLTMTQQLRDTMYPSDAAELSQGRVVLLYLPSLRSDSTITPAIRPFDIPEYQYDRRFAADIHAVTERHYYVQREVFDLSGTTELPTFTANQVGPYETLQNFERWPVDVKEIEIATAVKLPMELRQNPSDPSHWRLFLNEKTKLAVMEFRIQKQKLLGRWCKMTEAQRAALADLSSSIVTLRGGKHTLSVALRRPTHLSSVCFGKTPKFEIPMGPIPHGAKWNVDITSVVGCPLGLTVTNGKSAQLAFHGYPQEGEFGELIATISPVKGDASRLRLLYELELGKTPLASERLETMLKTNLATADKMTAIVTDIDNQIAELKRRLKDRRRPTTAAALKQYEYETLLIVQQIERWQTKRAGAAKRLTSAETNLVKARYMKKILDLMGNELAVSGTISVTLGTTSPVSLPLVVIL